MHLGDEVMAIGSSSGVTEFRVTDMRVDFKAADEAPKGTVCSVAVGVDNLLHASSAPHLRRGDKVYIWEKR